MKAVKLLRSSLPLALALALGSLLYPNSSFAQTWILTSAPTNAWSSVASSADGAKLVASRANGPIYTSTDSGATWSSNNSPVATGAAVASSADGNRLAAAGIDGFFYLSTNAGLTWSSNNAFTTGNPFRDSWSSVASSADGTKLVATIDASEILIVSSVNSGGSCSVFEEPGVSCISCGIGNSHTAASADATRLWVSSVLYFGGGPTSEGMFIISFNSGSQWIDFVGPDISWSGIAASADGMKLVATANLQGGGLIRVSTNGGASWNTTTAPARNWSAVTTSADGNHLAAVATSGSIYTSTNAGASWISNNAPALNWNSVASSADGTRLVAASLQGIYVSQPAPALSITPSDGNLTLSWPSTALVFGLQQNSELTTADWTPVTGSPGFTNGQYRLIVSPTNTATFYRLTSP